MNSVESCVGRDQMAWEGKDTGRHIKYLKCFLLKCEMPFNKNTPQRIQIDLMGTIQGLNIHRLHLSQKPLPISKENIEDAFCGDGLIQETSPSAVLKVDTGAPFIMTYGMLQKTIPPCLARHAFHRGRRAKNPGRAPEMGTSSSPDRARPASGKHRDGQGYSRAEP